MAALSGMQSLMPHRPEPSQVQNSAWTVYECKNVDKDLRLYAFDQVIDTLLDHIEPKFREKIALDDARQHRYVFYEHNRLWLSVKGVESAMMRLVKCSAPKVVNSTEPTVSEASDQLRMKRSYVVVKRR